MKDKRHVNKTVNSAYLILVSLQTTAGLFAATLVVTPRVIAQESATTRAGRSSPVGSRHEQAALASTLCKSSRPPR